MEVPAWQLALLESGCVCCEQAVLLHCSRVRMLQLLCAAAAACSSITACAGAAVAADSLVVWSVAGVAALCSGISVVLCFFLRLLTECASQLRHG